MEITRNFCNYSFILAGKRAFFYRFSDSGFKDKWTGFWIMPYKIFDYISVKISGTWLSAENIMDFKYDGKKAVSKYNLNGKIITETIFVPEDKKAVVIKIDGAKEVEYEIGFNIKKREENWHDRDYKIKNNTIEGPCKIKIDGAKIANSYYKDHYPGDEKQRCLVVVLKADKNILVISGEKIDVKKEEKNLKPMEKKFWCNDDNLEESFKWMAENIGMLYHKSKYGGGFFAGYPWFTMFWGRDSGWMIAGAVRLGMFEEAKSALDTLAKNSDDRIVNYLMTDGSKAYNSIDATLLWIISLHDYVFNSGDIAFLKKMKHKMKIYMSNYLSNLDDNGFPIHDLEESETWIDTYKRKGAIEIAVLWIRALECYSELLLLLKQENGYKDIAEEQKNKLEMLWDEGKRYYRDSLDSERITPNALFAPYFGIENHLEDILNTIESYNLNTDWGVRSLSNTDPEYDPSSYHKGSIWGFLTALTACVELKYGENGLKYLKILSGTVNEKCLGGTNETWDGDTKRPTGCCMQGWNAALFINAVDDFMLGIKIDAFADKDPAKCVTIDPRLPAEIDKIRRKRRIRNKWVEIVIERAGDKIISKIKVVK